MAAFNAAEHWGAPRLTCSIIVVEITRKRNAIKSSVFFY